jgi:hypothetical protein
VICSCGGLGFFDRASMRETKRYESVTGKCEEPSVSVKQEATIMMVSFSLFLPLVAMTSSHFRGAGQKFRLLGTAHWSLAHWSLATGDWPSSVRFSKALRGKQQQRQSFSFSVLSLFSLSLFFLFSLSEEVSISGVELREQSRSLPPSPRGCTPPPWARRESDVRPINVGVVRVV